MNGAERPAGHAANVVESVESDGDLRKTAAPAAKSEDTAAAASMQRINDSCAANGSPRADFERNPATDPSAHDPLQATLRRVCKRPRLRHFS